MSLGAGITANKNGAHRKVLSIDGGGIRGIIPAVVLRHIEHITNRPICELFDLVVGTSTGGILALGSCLPDASRGGRAKFSAADLLDLYLTRGSEIFASSALKNFSSLNGALDEVYHHAALERVLAHYFGESNLCASLKPCMVTAYDIESRCALFLKSWHEYHREVPMTHAARATSAAPTFFEPAKFEINQRERALIDGGVFMNSPAVSAYAEAKKLFPGDSISVLSLGTGELTCPIPFEDAAQWGKLGWVRPLIDCMFDGSAKAVDHQMALFLGDAYLRLQPTLTNANDSMDDVSPENLAALVAAAERLVETHSHLLERWLLGVESYAVS